MEIEIANFLEQVSDLHLSDDTKSKIRSMMRQISEIESIGDACYNMSRTLHRKIDTDKEFNEWQMKSLKEMMEITNKSLLQMARVLGGRREETSLRESINIEIEINAKRDELKAQNVDAINEHQYDYTVGTLFADLINECEKLADYVINVVEARLK